MTSWTRSQILGRSLEYANCLFKHFTISIQRQTKPSHSSIRGEGEVFLHLRLRNKVTARNSNHQDLGHFKKNKNMPQYAPSTLAWESQGHIAYCCSRVCNTITKSFLSFHPSTIANIPKSSASSPPTLTPWHRAPVSFTFPLKRMEQRPFPSGCHSEDKTAEPFQHSRPVCQLTARCILSTKKQNLPLLPYASPLSRHRFLCFCNGSLLRLLQ